jgi:hypothetical protein
MVLCVFSLESSCVWIGSLLIVCCVAAIAPPEGSPQHLGDSNKRSKRSPLSQTLSAGDRDGSLNGGEDSEDEGESFTSGGGSLPSRASPSKKPASKRMSPVVESSQELEALDDKPAKTPLTQRFLAQAYQKIDAAKQAKSSPRKPNKPRQRKERSVSPVPPPPPPSGPPPSQPRIELSVDELSRLTVDELAAYLDSLRHVSAGDLESKPLSPPVRRIVMRFSQRVLGYPGV